MKAELIARVCHEANRAYCQAIGDTSQPAWEDAPTWQKASALNGVNFHLATLNKGSQPVPSASHENWLKQKAEEGSHEQKMKDFIFCAIVEAFYEAEAKTVVVNRWP